MFFEHEEALQGLRHKTRDAKRVSTWLGFGPRFLECEVPVYSNSEFAI